MMETLRVDENMPIESKMVSKSLEKSQQRVEGNHFDMRKHLLDYDDVLNKHRIAIYERRNAILQNEDLDAQKEILEMIEDEVERVVLFHASIDQGDVPEGFKKQGNDPEAPEKKDWDPKEVVEILGTIMPMEPELETVIKKALPELLRDKERLAAQRTEVIEAFMAAAKARLEKLRDAFEDKDRVQKLERTLLLRAIDNMWVQHLDTMTYLRRSIGLQGYGQRDPLVEYKREAFDYFNRLNESIDREIVYNVFKVLENAVKMQQVAALAPSIIERARLQFAGAAKTMAPARAAATVSARASKGSVTIGNVTEPQIIETTSVSKVGRNEPCPCGSGKKYKKCHGA